MNVAPIERTSPMGSQLAPSPRVTSSPAYYLGHLVLPLLAAMASLYALEMLGGNRLIADHIFAWEGGQWSLREHPITSSLIHPGGKYFSLLMWAAGVALWWRSRTTITLQKWRRPLLYLLVATLVGIFLVTLLKALIHMDCPWDMQGYGGVRPYLSLFDARPSGLHSSGCFPAGHASSGYAWVALYFFFTSTRPRWRLAGLLVGLTMGAVFGISQQLRGAHFLSHDVIALLVCWLSALMVHQVMRMPSAESRQ